VPGWPGLQGHSDADVLTHAIIDALLGAAALGDIGRHFPDDDPRYSGASSIGLLETAVGLLRAAGWQVVNLDSTVICESPRLAELVPLMVERLATAAGTEPGAVSVKATTHEGMGALGRGEGIAACAIAQVERLP
jgi:2-C-methyl-D-erythritol 2,4-cyclodiphosphate synthase